MLEELKSSTEIRIQQIYEFFEVAGFETRNKYAIHNQTAQIGFAAEQQKGFLGFLLRQFLGHWRSYAIHIFDISRREVLIVEHPFRFIFQRLEVKTPQGQVIGALQQRFGIINKKFDLLDPRGKLLMKMRSPIWRLWTFRFYQRGRVVAQVLKKWSGLLAEAFTDRDQFLLKFDSPSLSETEKCLLLVSAIFVDLSYFEGKAGGGGPLDLLGD